MFSSARRTRFRSSGYPAGRGSFSVWRPSRWRSGRRRRGSARGAPSSSGARVRPSAGRPRRSELRTLLRRRPEPPVMRTTALPLRPRSPAPSSRSDSPQQRGARRAALGAAALVGGLVLWGAANGAVLHRYDELSVARQRRYLVVANDLNRASQDRRCAFSFTGIVPPQLEIAARCEAHAFPRARELPLPVLVRQMNRWARQEARDGVVPFVVWVEVNRLRPEWGHWRLIRRVFGTGLGESAMLVFRPLA